MSHHHSVDINSIAVHNGAKPELCSFPGKPLCHLKVSQKPHASDKSLQRRVPKKEGNGNLFKRGLRSLQLLEIPFKSLILLVQVSVPGLHVFLVPFKLPGYESIICIFFCKKQILHISLQHFPAHPRLDPGTPKTGIDQSHRNPCHLIHLLCKKVGGSRKLQDRARICLLPASRLQLP